ncbi:MAG: polysaccharide export protein [Sulfitobacter sp.]|nr:polysaccharide export protein [Sulfitobacter sp.]
MRFLICLLLLPVLVACTALPCGAAVERDILASTDAEAPEVAVYPVTRAFLPALADWPAPDGQDRKWIGHTRGSDAQIIRPGDRLDMVVWESGENALLTGADQRATRMEGLRVSAAGTIFVPYVGALKVSGRTPDSARGLVQRKLEESVPAVQVQLLMAEGRHNAVDLVAGVRTPGPVPMPDQNFTVLSALSAGGGVLPGLRNPQVRLMRGTSVYATSLERLYSQPKLDTRLRGGDKLIVEEDRRYFLALGAAGKEAQVPFNRDSISALDAVALMGGLQDSRADPGGILILRSYPEGIRGPSQPRVVFTLDLTTSDGLFSARQFLIRPQDLVLATESPMSNTGTILALFGSAIGLSRVID